MLWIKAFHIVFVVSWFAGLFYLPRLFVYHCEAETDAEHRRFCTMEQRLYRLMDVAGILAIGFGLWMLWLVPGFLQAGWMHAKLTVVVALVAYQFWLRAHMKRFAAGSNQHSARYFRIINEVPAVALIAIAILVVVKPF